MIKKPTKTHQICLALLDLAPATRVEILHRVWVDGPSKIPFKERSNHCYFTRYARPPHRGGEYSLVVRGFIKISGKTDSGRFLYALTPKGRRVAKAYSACLNAVSACLNAVL